MKRRDDRVQAGEEAVAVLRVEQLHPFPEKEILAILDDYPALEEVVWLQDEPENMGAWNYVHGRLHRILRNRAQLRHVSRPLSGSPATGSVTIHQLEAADLLDRSVGPEPS
jgi:2-oxoglutarate dehydrogenase E1 component